MSRDPIRDGTPCERAARWNRFDQTLIEVRSRFSDLSVHELHEMIDDAVAAARHG